MSISLKKTKTIINSVFKITSYELSAMPVQRNIRPIILYKKTESLYVYTLYKSQCFYCRFPILSSTRFYTWVEFTICAS